MLKKSDPEVSLGGVPNMEYRRYTLVSPDTFCSFAALLNFTKCLRPPLGCLRFCPSLLQMVKTIKKVGWRSPWDKCEKKMYTLQYPEPWLFLTHIPELCKDVATILSRFCIQA